ncbi:MAG: CRISPR-associated endonuclease Cas1 1 [Candidatus Argoarchaeum ethanivorans]|uniref:CRISPR-associated endonuclease Cas1 n=1 Tax=Candidatus Argoarchaeum ethanivorans TaxID=2608793 RepID=A0A811T3C6_9EURY|nr:MAG: CRISPR-associated endonuclease Cas1 1 [Candidatus Argoarchaeum ethanivorans]
MTMQLVLNTRGSYLKKSKNCFLVKTDDKAFEVSANKVDSILITTAATITTDAIKFAVDNNIDIVFLDHNGYPFGRVWHSKLGSTTLIRRRQLEIANTTIGFNMAKKWVEIKIDNQIILLKDLKKNRPDTKEQIESHIESMVGLESELAAMKGVMEYKRGRLMGLEGMCSREYFKALSLIMPEKWSFSGRSRNPAEDGFNCLLNYGYGVLYSKVEKACIIAGLDPYAGITHTDNYNKKSFVFDLIEPFRTHVDRTVVHLFSKKKVKDEFFDAVPGGFVLNREGKAVLIQEINETFEKKMPYHGRNIRTGNTIQYECHRIANGLIKGG